MIPRRILALAPFALARLACTHAPEAGPRLDRIIENKVLRVGTPDDYRPFAMKTDSGLSGHDIDIVELVARNRA